MRDDPIRPSRAGQWLDADTWDALRKAGVSEQELLADQPAGPVIFAYTRAAAIRDGVLIDLSQGPVARLCRQAGLRHPLAMTAAAFARAVGANLTVRLGRIVPDYQGPAEPCEAAWEHVGQVLAALRAAIAKTRGQPYTDRVFFDVPPADSGNAQPVALWCHHGPGDAGEPVLTIMLTSED